MHPHRRMCLNLSHLLYETRTHNNHHLQTYSQNQTQTIQKWDLDIKTHRERMKKEELDKQFKDAASKLRVVFVCAMWLTGFDVKTLSCLHIDKPIHLPSIHIIHQRPRQSRHRPITPSLKNINFRTKHGKFTKLFVPLCH